VVAGWREAAGGALMGKVLQSFYKSVESLGFEAGGEFKAAIEEGRAQGAKILLGDRDVDVTLQHLASALESSGPDALERLATRVEQVNKDSMGTIDESVFRDKQQLAGYVERMKQRKTLSSIMGAVHDEVPLLYEALIGERDAFMARSIATAEAALIVAVVGIAHMTGIEKGLLDRQYKIVRNNCPSRP
jgi:pheromone shutdown protein TraB